MAVIPGILEEFFFRGLVQVRFQAILKNHHQSIVLAAFLFSLFHFQFYSFIPRFAMGLLLGYIFFWSKNIWYPIAGHIMNNLIGIVGFHFFGWQVGDSEQRAMTEVVLLSLIVSVFVLVFLRKRFYKVRNVSP